jgi:hypothetical protein
MLNSRLLALFLLTYQVKENVGEGFNTGFNGGFFDINNGVDRVAPTPAPIPSDVPSVPSSNLPSVTPSEDPSFQPSNSPSVTKAASPLDAPSVPPQSKHSSVVPSQRPSSQPSAEPSNSPSLKIVPLLILSSVTPSQGPTSKPSVEPSDSPSITKSASLLDVLSLPPSMHSTTTPSKGPISQPSSKPRFLASVTPSEDPSSAPTKSPTKHPSSTPSKSPTSQPSSRPTALDRIDPVGQENTGAETPTPVPVTMTMTGSQVIAGSVHKFEWGSVTDTCTYTTPKAYLHCGTGGLITLLTQKNADCIKLADDYLRCSSLGPEDSVVEFACTGISQTHLTAMAQVFGSEATNCDAKGNAIVYGVLGRYCMGDEHLVLKNIHECSTGLMTVINENGEDAVVCANGNLCAGDGCSMLVDGFAVDDFDENPQCAGRDGDVDLTDIDNMTPSILASFHLVEWTFSGSSLGCEWEVPNLTLSCSNGGSIELRTDVGYCHQQGLSTLVCENPNPGTEDYRVSNWLDVWCRGDNEDQLDLEAEIPTAPSAGECAYRGMAIQGIWLSRACGDKDDYTYWFLPEFCEIEDQYYDPGNDEDNPFCLAGDICDGSVGCNSVQVLPVAARNSNVMGTCIYAVPNP